MKLSHIKDDQGRIEFLSMCGYDAEDALILQALYDLFARGGEMVIEVSGKRTTVLQKGGLVHLQ